jgi:DNA-binding HxlR family transcriptional regulator
MRKESSTNRQNEKSITNDCPIVSTLKMIGGRWKIIILWNLKGHALRYKELHRAIPNITEKMLTQQLAVLVEDGWVLKKDFKEIPPRTEYSLSALGQSFIPVLTHIYEWGIAHDIVDIVNAKYAGQDDE